MAQWQFELNLKDIFKDQDHSDENMKEKGKEVAKRLRKLIPIINVKYSDYVCELEEIADQFECTEDAEGFDYNLKQLYDISDSRLDDTFGGKVLMWIETF